MFWELWNTVIAQVIAMSIFTMEMLGWETIDIWKLLDQLRQSIGE